eukprot:362807-Chlamydomonas_euryale.AAC.5
MDPCCVVQPANKEAPSKGKSKKAVQVMPAQTAKATPENNSRQLHTLVVVAHQIGCMVHVGVLRGRDAAHWPTCMLTPARLDSLRWKRGHADHPHRVKMVRINRTKLSILMKAKLDPCCVGLGSGLAATRISADGPSRGMGHDTWGGTQ